MRVNLMLRGALATALGVAVGGSASAQDANPYMRATLGVDWSRASIFFDRDCTRPNSGPEPWSFYGCGPGEDGLPLGAYGDFGHSIFLELGLGIEPSPGIRLETTAGFRPGFEFVGNANFTGAGDIQPVRASVNQFNVTNFLYLDLLEIAGVDSRWQPFIGAGFGVTRNAIGTMRVDFPEFDGNVTRSYVLVPSGVNWDVTWSLVAGVSFDVSDRLVIEFAYRFNHLGDVETAAGLVFAQRANGSTATFDTIPTFAPLSSHGLTLSLRWAL
ncbi:MAG: outer membrane protein [Bauldia sp.]